MTSSHSTTYRDCPMRRGNRTVPPSIRGTPKRRQNTPNTASDAVIRISHQIASSNPPNKCIINVTPIQYLCLRYIWFSTTLHWHINKEWGRHIGCIRLKHLKATTHPNSNKNSISLKYTTLPHWLTNSLSSLTKPITHQPLRILPLQQSQVYSDADVLGPWVLYPICGCLAFQQCCLPQRGIVGHIQHRNSLPRQ